MSILRSFLGGAKDEYWVEPDPALSQTMVNYFDRIDDRKQIRDALIARYGTGIRIEKDKAGNKIETYVDRGFEVQVRSGQIEAISIGLGHTIAASLATLFTEAGQRWTLDPETERDTKLELDYLMKQMRLGCFKSAMVAADFKSVPIGSSFVLIMWSDGHLKYKAYPPGRIKVCFGSAVVDEGLPRGVDMSRLEDARKVIIQTGSIDGQTQSYLAIFGQSDDWPLGRYVTYQAKDGGKDVPAEGSKDTWDYLDPETGAPANPLTLYALANPDIDAPEYPIVILKSGILGGDGLFPMSNSLHQESLEADISASHTRGTAQDAARGTTVITRQDAARAAALPRNVFGIMDLPPNMDAKRLDHGSAASMDAWEVQKGQMTQSARSFGVPDYQAVSDDHTVEGSSGIALKVKTIPMIKWREFRADLNYEEILKIFAVEKGLISQFSEAEESIVSGLVSCAIDWDPGPYEIPKDDKAEQERALALLNAGAYDVIDVIRVTEQANSDEEAITIYEKKKDRLAQYPPLNQAQKDKERQESLEAVNNKGGFPR